MANGNLRDLLISARPSLRDQVKVDGLCILKFAVDIARGMAFCEEKGVVHRDLAARLGERDGFLFVCLSVFVLFSYARLFLLCSCSIKLI